MPEPRLSDAELDALHEELSKLNPADNQILFWSVRRGLALVREVKENRLRVQLFRAECDRLNEEIEDLRENPGA